MSLIRQVWMLVLGVIALAFVGSVLVSIGAARAYLETQLTLKNSDNAQSLALTLSQQGGDAAMMELALAAQFDTGSYQSIRLRSPDGRVLAERLAGEVTIHAPSWFMRAVPIASPAGVAQVSSGWKALGSVEVVSQPIFAYAELWSGAVRTSIWMGLLGALAVLAGQLGVRRLRRPLDAVVDQAAALTERRFITVPEPRTPELRRVAQAMNSMVERLRLQFAEQSEQLQQLRRQANCDTLTGLSHRRHFLARFDSLLTGEDGWADGHLWLVRVLRLADLNRKLGHSRTDGLLQSMAQMLAQGDGLALPSAPEAAGRLNGTDFALLLRSIDPRDATALQARLRQLLADMDGAAVVISTVNWRHGDTVAAVMTRADAALARAEARGDFVLEQQDQPLAPDLLGGEDAWRRNIEAALSLHRTQLVQFPVVDRLGALLHHECPLRIQLDGHGAYQPAAHWLPYAIRTQLTPHTDEVAVTLALDAIAADGQARGINISPLSLLDAGFVPRLRSRIAKAGTVAQRLWIEVDETAVYSSAAAVVELCAQLRPLGVHLGLEHAGERVAAVAHLLEAGLDFIKLDASVVRDVAGDTARQALVRGTVTLLHGLGLQVYAEGVQEPDDLSCLWDCGVDGATGPAVRIALAN